MKYILIVFVLVCKGVWSDVADGKSKETSVPADSVVINNSTTTPDIPITVITTPNGTTPNNTTPATPTTSTTSTTKPTITTLKPNSTSATTPTTPTTPTSPTTSIKPTPPSPPTNKTTTAPLTTPSPAPVTTTPPHKDRRFDGPSFIGGIVLASGLMAVGFVAFKFYKARTERNYHTL